MRAPRSQPLLVAGIAALALLASACRGVTADPFPLEVGFQPLEATSPLATLPPASGNELHPQGLGPIIAVPEAGHYASHARGYLQAPLAKVYAALKDPTASYIHNQTDGSTRLAGPTDLDVEPFPISFRVHYSSTSRIGDQDFDVTYRGGPSQGTEAAPVAIGQRYQKTWGVSDIRVMTGSLVATAVDGAPGVTSVELVEWLDATTQGQGNCDGTLTALFGDLTYKLDHMTWP